MLGIIGYHENNMGIPNTYILIREETDKIPVVSLLKSAEILHMEDYFYTGRM